MIYSIEAERSVIGSLILGADFDLVSNEVTTEDFFQLNHQIIFNAVGFMVGSGLSIDLLTLNEYLERRKEIDSVGGFVYLAELAQSTPSVANSVAYAKIVKEKSILRSLSMASMKIQELAKGELGVDEKIAQAQNLILSVGVESKEADTCEMTEVLRDVVADIQERAEGKAVDGLLTSYKLYDGLLKGLKGGHTHVMAGRPGSGKTTLAINIAERVAEKVPVLVFSLEMPRKELVRRMIASLGRVPVDAIDDGNLDGKWDNLSAGVNKLKQLPISICDKGGLSISRIRTIARFHKKAKNTGLIVIDYIGLIRTPNSKNSNRNLELGEVSRQLKEMAKELNIPVIILAQLNRGIENRADKTPTLADLRDSGEIEQDADTVTFLYRPQDAENGETSVTLAKNRHGKTGAFSLVLSGQYSRFDDMAYTANEHWSKKY